MATEASDPLVILGAGYAGLTVTQEVHRRSRGKIPIVLVDRSPAHVLRTELYQIGEIASAPDTARWTVPLADLFERTPVRTVQATIQGIDLAGRTVPLDSGPIRYRALAICLGSAAAYYGVPGAAEFTHQIYRLSGAQRLAAALREMETASSRLRGERRPRLVVIGGGTTGVELAAEVATTDWAAITGPGTRPPEVVLLTGSLPFLAGLPAPVVERAARALRRSGVAIVPGLNVTRVEPGRVSIEDGSVFACDVAVWCAGLEAPPVVKALPVPHGKAGRLAVEPTLMVPGHPEVVGVGDVIEVKDPTTGAVVPGTAQAALAEARVAARNLVAAWNGRPLVPFEYRERGVLVALGLGEGAGSVRHLTVWGSPASILKRLVQRDYARSVEHGSPPSLL